MILFHFARATFQFSAREQSACEVSAGMKTFSARTFQNAPAPRAVSAGVTEKPLKNRLEDLNVLDAVGPSFFHDRPATGERFAPYVFRLVAQAAQVASAQPERVRSILFYTGDT